MAQFFRGGTPGAPLDPALIDDMTLWFDERFLAPDGSAATVIELNALSAKAYSTLLSTAKYTPEQGRYFGQVIVAQRPALGAFKGWRCMTFVHDNSGGGIGTLMLQINTNVSVTPIIGSAASFFYPGRQYTGFLCAPVPTTLVNGENYIGMMIQGQTWFIYGDYSTAGPQLNMHIFHQGATGGSVNPSVNVLAGGFAAPGDLLCFAPWWDGTTVQMDVMRPDGTVVSTASSAIDGMGVSQINPYKFVIGGFSGLSSWQGPILAGGICMRSMPQAERRALMQKLLTKYNTVTGQAWPDGPVPMSPLDYHPENTWSPGAFTVAGGLVSHIANAGGDGASGFSAAGAARPTKSTIGTLDSLIGDGVATVMTQDSGTEADINQSRSSRTMFGVIKAKQQATTFPGTATPLSGDSGLASGLVYIAGGVRGPMVIWSDASGLAFTTVADAWLTNQILVFCMQACPSLPCDGKYSIRTISEGAMQTSGTADQIGSYAGKMYIGEHITTGTFYDGDFVPQTFSSREYSYRLVQAVLRWYQLAVGNALP